ncbi:hypothetical protein Ciccas_000844 [Cichlidogyrus casuarinus]|uniref:Uncharacterized protein n=1 Tax=Cichlidogyrus casuarinus TaxID=1844966 RepID=A0ABD2QLS8_9PLAT
MMKKLGQMAGIIHQGCIAHAIQLGFMDYFSPRTNTPEAKNCLKTQKVARCFSKRMNPPLYNSLSGVSLLTLSTEYMAFFAHTVTARPSATYSRFH